MHILLVLLAAVTLAVGPAAQSPLTTTFAGGGSNNIGGTNLFDLTVHRSLSITQIDVHTVTAVGTPGTLEVLITPTTYLGNASNPAAWTVVSPAAGNPLVSRGPGMPTVCVLGTPIVLLPGDYGVMLVSDTWQIARTNGTGCTSTTIPGSCTNTLFGNAELTLRAGAAQNGQWGGSFTPRTPNLNIHYVTDVAYQRRYGAGCYHVRTGFYEQFPVGAFDLAGSVGATNSFQLVPNGIGGYVLAPGSNAFFTPGSPDLALIDDSVSGALAMPFTFAYPGGTTDQLRIGSNGMVFPTTATSTETTPAVSSLLSGVPRYCPAWRNLNPGAGGTTHFDVDPGNMAVYCTWSAVPGNGASLPNTMQVAVFASGVVEFRYREMDLGAVTLVGYSEGGSVPDPGSIDLSVQIHNAYSTGRGALPLTLTASARPVLGTVLDLVATNLGTAPVGANVLSFTRTGLGLASIGMPGCQQYVGLDVVEVWLPVSGAGQTTLALPNVPAFAGVQLFGQSAAFGSVLNALGVTSSNGLELVVDVN